MGNFSCKEPSYHPPHVLVMGIIVPKEQLYDYDFYYDRRPFWDVKELIPTIDQYACLKKVTTQGVEMSCWDYGGRDSGRFMHEAYNRHARGHVIVVDSSDGERLEYELKGLVDRCLLEESTKDTAVMILADKQNQPNALKCNEVEEMFWQKIYTESSRPVSDHKILFRPCSVETGEGLATAFEDFVMELQKGKGKAVWRNKMHDGKQENPVKLFMKKPVAFAKSVLSR